MKKISLLLSVVMLLSLGLAGCKPAGETKPQGTAAEPTTLVVSTWGINEDLFRKNVFAPFEKANNVKIVLDLGNNGDRLNKIKSRPGSADVIYLADYYALQAVEEGLFEKIDRKNIPNVNNLYDIAKAPLGEEYGPAYTMNRLGIVYDPAVITKPITSWGDLWRNDLVKKTSVPDMSITAGPLMALIAGEQAGVNAKDNNDKMFAKLKDLNPNVVKYYTKSSELANMFNQGEIGVAVMQDFAYSSVQKGSPKAVWVDPQEGSYAGYNVINVVKGTKNKELAEKFINWVLSEDVQKANALDKIDSPVNKNIQLSADQAKGLTYGADTINKLKLPDWKYINSVYKQWIDRFNKEVTATGK